MYKRQAQVDHFVQNIKAKRIDGENTFRSALQADRIVSMIIGETGGSPAPMGGVATAAPARKGLWSRVFG